MLLHPPPQRGHPIKPPEPAHFKPLPRPRRLPTWAIRLLLAYSLAFWVLVLWTLVTHP